MSDLVTAVSLGLIASVPAGIIFIIVFIIYEASKRK